MRKSGIESENLGVITLEHLCRCITRPAIASERLTRNKDGQIVLKLKTPYRDGTTHIIMSPLEFMQRLATLVPRPKLNLIPFYGVLVPSAKLRPKIIPGEKKNKSNASDTNDHVPSSTTSVRISWVRLLKRLLSPDLAWMQLQLAQLQDASKMLLLPTLPSLSDAACHETK